ncbi:hypothetical protein ABZY81_39415 [Streptomyces sp. NPDC006514]|uniref:hypothetical protein n=1 Tax=Streptomyces sp. NPDC006514 TaxID=3154308 RepID=UPI00339FB20E
MPVYSRHDRQPKTGTNPPRSNSQEPAVKGPIASCNTTTCAIERVVELAALAFCDVLNVAWHRHLGLAGLLPADLDLLYEQSVPLAVPTAPSEPPTGGEADFVGVDLAGRALHWLLERPASEMRIQELGLDPVCPGPGLQP